MDNDDSDEDGNGKTRTFSYSNLRVREHRQSRFRPFVIIHFNAIVLDLS